MSELVTCSCGREITYSYQDQIPHCEHCGAICCDSCTHQCSSPDHTVNDLGCEKCMILDKTLDEWFCCEECHLDYIDPLHFYRSAREDKTNMSLAVLEVCKKLDEAMATTDSFTHNSLINEAKVMLVTSAQLYLLKEKK